MPINNSKMWYIQKNVYDEAKGACFRRRNHVVLKEKGIVASDLEDRHGSRRTTHNMSHL